MTCYAASSRRDYCGPATFPPAVDQLWRNRGDGSFENVSLASGIAKAGRGMGVVAVDVDRDGLQDLFVANDGMFNFLWKNRGAMRFEEVGLPAGVAVNADREAEAIMGIAVGDVPDVGVDQHLVVEEGKGIVPR